MKLIDTSIWIEFFRKKGDRELKERLADVITKEEAAYTCTNRFELMLGALDHELADLETGLSFAERVTIDSSVWDLASEKGRHLRRKGITVPVSDLLIAVTGIHHDLPIVCRDKHFVAMKDGGIGNLQIEIW